MKNEPQPPDDRDELIERLVEALKFYAEKNNYEDQDNSCSDPECCGGPSPYYPVVNDEGCRAKQALATLPATFRK